MNTNNIGLNPFDERLEQGVLGTILSYTHAFQEVSHIISTSSFYNKKHQRIFSAAKSISISNKQIDMITISHQLRKDGFLEEIGGNFYITQLCELASGIYQIQHHAAIIQEMAIARKLVTIGIELNSKAIDPINDVFDIINEATQELEKLTDIHSADIETLANVFTKQKKYYLSTSINNITGITSGFDDIDHLTNGWQKSNLIIIAGRPAMGKTAFMLNLILNAVMIGNENVGVFSLEMSKEQLTDRFAAFQSDVNLNKLNKRHLTDHEKSIIENIDLRPLEKILIDDTGFLSIQQLKHKAKALKRKHNISLLLVDYLQLLKGEGEKIREQEISNISRQLKAISKTLDIPVIALSQLSRTLESRPDKRPILSDLRESGSIEQDADMVLFLYRAEYYGIKQDENGNDTEGLTEIIFAKNRQGQTGTIDLRFDGSRMKFINN